MMTLCVVSGPVERRGRDQGAQNAKKCAEMGLNEPCSVAIRGKSVRACAPRFGSAARRDRDSVRSWCQPSGPVSSARSRIEPNADKSKPGKNCERTHVARSAKTCVGEGPRGFRRASTQGPRGNLCAWEGRGVAASPGGGVFDVDPPPRPAFRYAPTERACVCDMD